jgi:tetratricopeptide (TPR) repeat protein
MMSMAHAEPPSLSHAVFLQRAAQAVPLRGGGLQSRLAQSAFLALRLVDLLAPEREPVHPDAFRYQCAATERFCRDLRMTSTEGAHLQALVASAGGAQRNGDVGLLLPGLFAYAHYLEDEMRLDEALDVLWTLRAVGARRISPADTVALWLRAGRVNRKLNRFEHAEEAYAEAGQIAAAAGDAHSELLSRIGRAHGMLGRGNLPEAERCFGSALGDARRAGDRALEAQSEHGLAAALQHRVSPDTALGHAWRAFELYEDEDSRLRALGDVGLMLLMLGDAKGAEHALSEVVRRGASHDLIANALIELMHCASFQRDRVGFERWRTRSKEAGPRMPPNILADYHLKSGIGEARFGLFRRSRASLTRAHKVAEDAGLHEFVFKIERIKDGLRVCEEALGATSTADAEPVTQSEAVRKVSASIAHVAAGQA